MKKNNYFVVIAMLLWLAFPGQLMAQAPQGIPYQSILRNSSGNILANQNVSLRFSLHDGTATGPLVYQETHAVATNNEGLVILNIGMGTATVDTFSTINWGVNAKFLQLEMDMMGGSAYTDMGTQQMMSVPYALYAGSSSNGINGFTSLIYSSPAFGYCLNTNGAGSTGGIVLQFGLDLDRNNILDYNEITQTQYICNGEQGMMGIPGRDGIDGPRGMDGINGTSVVNAQIIDNNLYIYLSDGSIINAGYVGNNSSANGSLSTISTGSITNISYTTATATANLIDNGNGLILAKGVCLATQPNPGLGNSITVPGSSTGAFTVDLTSLTPNTTYYLRAFAVNTAGTSFGDEVSFTTTAFAIGQSYQGGIIFYIDGTGQHGLIAATSDQSTGAQWGCNGTSIPGTSTGIGTGQANTTLIVNGCSTAGIAARICNDLVLNGYSDWFLPSKDELNLMYAQRTTIGGFAVDYYWSSSEYDANYAWSQVFTNGYQSNYPYTKIYSAFYVRAVRAF